MKYVLDLSTIAALMRGNPEAVARLEERPRFEVAVPQTVVAEIRFGLARLRPSNRRRRLEETWALFEKELHRAPWTEEERRRYLGDTSPAVIPEYPRQPRHNDEIELLPDSPEFLAYTIDDIGFREIIDSAFREAIARARGVKRWR